MSTSPRIETPRRIALHALGCKANQEEMDGLASTLSAAGWEIVPFGQPAPWIVVDTCTVTAAADSDSRQALRQAARTGARVVATGCLAQRDPGSLAKILGVDWVIGNAEKPSLGAWIDQAALDAPAAIENAPQTIRVSADPTVTQFAAHGRTTARRRTRGSLKVQEGCDERCTFCVIPSVRGASRSRPIAACRVEAETLVANGHREIALTGINTALWGRDLSPPGDLLTLLRALADVEGVLRLRINSLEPQYVRAEWLDELAADPRLCAHLHLPLQSGSDATLRRMNRRYVTHDYRELVRAAQRKIPGIAVGADLLVGSPGETADDFERTREFIASLSLAYLHVFTYSERAGTPATRLGGGVPMAERRRRSGELRRLDRDLRCAYIAGRIGSQEVVIPEQVGVDGQAQGLSGNYLRVRYSPPPGRDPRTPARVRLLSPEDGGVSAAFVDWA